MDIVRTTCRNGLEHGGDSAIQFQYTPKRSGPWRCGNCGHRIATYKLAKGSDPLPPGFSLHPVTGTLSGTPTTAGISNLTIQHDQPWQTRHLARTRPWVLITEPFGRFFARHPFRVGGPSRFDLAIAEAIARGIRDDEANERLAMGLNPVPGRPPLVPVDPKDVLRWLEDGES
jgi:Putative Ig domain